MISFGGGEDNKDLGFRLILTASVLLLVLSSLITYCYPATISDGSPTEYSALEDEYKNFTNSNPTSESIWCLTGIFSSVGADANGAAYSGYGYTEDGWIYGVRIENYNPSQYASDPDRVYSYSASYNGTLYKYNHDESKYNKHSNGDLYGSVPFDVNHKSNIFFSSNNVVQTADGFYYEFSGWRYVWQPVLSHQTYDADGNIINVVPNQTSLSLIWYDFYGNSGLSGNLIISGNAPGDVAYLSSAMIVSAFDSNTSTSKFLMTFNGVTMNIYIRLDASKLSSGMTVEQCYNLGYWSVMVSSMSVDTDSVISSDYEFNPFTVFQTMIDLLTFKMEDYGISGIAGSVCGVIIVMPLFIGLICIGMKNYPVLIFAGIYSVITAWNWGIFG